MFFVKKKTRLLNQTVYKLAESIKKQASFSYFDICQLLFVYHDDNGAPHRLKSGVWFGQGGTTRHDTVCGKDKDNLSYIYYVPIHSLNL